MMVAQVAKQILGVPQAVARVYDPSREAIYHGLEIETTCPTTLAADAAVELLSAFQAAEVSA
jgi:trk system potassium uptake protein TrkA